MRHLVQPHQVVERVVQRAQVGIDFLRQVAGQEAEALARLHRRAHQHQALHRLALQRVHRAGHGEIGLAGSGGADAEGDVVLLDGLQVIVLARGAAAHFGLARHQQRHELGLRFRPAVVAHRLDQAELQLFKADVVLRVVIEILQHLARQLGLCASPCTLKCSPRREMTTSSAVSIWRRFSSNAPHRLASRALSTGSSEN